MSQSERNAGTGGRTIAIGDIHGCADALESILQAVKPTPEDLIVPLGDYVDRGPDSNRVLDQLIALAQTCRLEPLLGNHELMLMAALQNDSAYAFWLQYGGAETLASYGGQLEAIPPHHLQFVKRCRHYFETPSHIFLHANYNPRQPLTEQEEEDLFWRHLSEALPGPHRSGKIAIVGHTPQLDGLILDRGHVICIDTFCFGSGCLTALDVNTRQCWQADKSGELY